MFREADMLPSLDRVDLRSPQCVRCAGGRVRIAFRGPSRTR